MESYISWMCDETKIAIMIAPGLDPKQYNFSPDLASSPWTFCTSSTTVGRGSVFTFPGSEKNRQ